MMRPLSSILICLAAGVSAMTAHADWKADADARIETHRKGDFTVMLTLPGTRSAAGLQVELEQDRSAFLFGTAVNGWQLPREGRPDSPDKQKYRAYITRHFNAVVSEDDMKWYSIEKERGKPAYAAADAFMRFAEDNHLAVRGHCLFWSKLKYVQRQPWLPAMEGDDLRAAIDRHIADTAGRYKGRVLCWDVNNEMLDGAWYKDKLGEGIRADMFIKAGKADPAAALYVNEYGILASDAKTDRYIELIKSLRAAGAPVGGIGIQEHAAERFSPSETRDPPDPKHPERQDTGPIRVEEVLKRLDRLAQFNLPIHMTEVSFYTADEARKAEALENFYRLAFSHPKVEAILLWGFWSRSHFLGDRAALVDKEWNPTLAGQKLEKLLLKDFRTSVRAVADDNGEVKFRGFYGRYRVRVTVPPNTPGGDPAVAAGTVELNPGTKWTQAKLVIR